ncbi:MAG: 6-bladed beta-propeller [Terriglobales bacterium]
MTQYECSTSNSFRKAGSSLAALVLVLICLQFGFADQQKAKAKAAPAPTPAIDLSKLVWPPAPDVARVRYVTGLAGEEDLHPTVGKKKKSLIDRMAGVTLPAEAGKPALNKPYGVAVDSKGLIYVADSGNAVVFVFDLEGKKIAFRGAQQLALPSGVAIDDSDRLFVSDSRQHVVLVFKPDGALETSIGQDKLVRPVGIALDLENRYLYVVDAILDKVFVYDADTYLLLRSFGQKSDATLAPGTFDRPTNVAVDSDSNVYVVDTFNERIQVFDADGQFVRMFGKEGNVAGTFMRPKGIAVDADNHVYVVDSEFNNVQVFDSEGRLLMFFGTRGEAPGTFTLASGIAIDQHNRVIVSEQWRPARIQVFQYLTDAETKPEYDKRAAELAAKEAAEKKAAEEEQKKISGDKKN